MGRSHLDQSLGGYAVLEAMGLLFVIAVAIY